MRGGIDAVDEHAAIAHLEPHRTSERADRRRVVEGDVAAHRRERDSAIHRARIEVLRAQLLGQRLADGALAGAGRAVDRDDAHVGLGHDRVGH
jgi:hypothetical protein